MEIKSLSKDKETVSKIARHNAQCSGVGSNSFFRNTAETSTLSPRISNHELGKYWHV
jgi:hypothetical protein